MNILWEIVNEMPALTNEQLGILEDGWELYPVLTKCWWARRQTCCSGWEPLFDLTIILTECTDWDAPLVDINWIFIDNMGNPVTSWILPAWQTTIVITWLTPWFYNFGTLVNVLYQPLSESLPVFYNLTIPLCLNQL